MCSSGTLEDKAGRLVERVMRKLERKDIGEENLKSLRGEINLMFKLLRRNSKRTHSIVIKKLVKLKDKINDALDSALCHARKLHTVPNGTANVSHI